LNNNTTASGTTALTASSGLYVLQLGAQAAVRLDAYNKLLSFQHSWDESGSQGGASTLALAPNAPSAFITSNNVSIRTIPQTAASVLTDCTLSLQFGSGSGTSFVAAIPNNGDVARIYLCLSRSGAI